MEVEFRIAPLEEVMSNFLGSLNKTVFKIEFCLL